MRPVVPGGLDQTMFATMQTEQDLVELEIGAFMGPHIKRARIALVLIGVLYAIVAYLGYGDIAHWRAMMKGAPSSDPAYAHVMHLVDVSYYFVVFTGIAGAANVVLALLAGTMTTIAIYAAMGIFVAHSCFQLYMSGALLFTSWLWWISAIVLGMGFQAAYKAQKLRKERMQAGAQ